MEAFLKSMGVDITLKAVIGGNEDLTLVQSSVNWMPINDGLWAEVDGIDDYTLLLLLESSGSRVWVDMTFQDRKVTLEYDEYQRWLRSLVATIELQIQEKFDLFYDISMKVEETEIDQALRGEIKMGVPKKKTMDGKPIHPTEEEKLLAKVFGKPQ